MSPNRQRRNAARRRPPVTISQEEITADLHYRGGNRGARTLAEATRRASAR